MYIFLGVISTLIVATISLGVILNKKRSLTIEHPKLAKKVLGANFASFATLMVLALISLLPGGHTFAATSQAATSTVANSSATGLGLLGAGLSTGLAAIGAGIGVGISGAAGIGAISEDPSMLGKSLIYVGLAEGTAIYGLIISIMIMGRI